MLENSAVKPWPKKCRRACSLQHLQKNRSFSAKSSYKHLNIYKSCWSQDQLLSKWKYWNSILNFYYFVKFNSSSSWIFYFSITLWVYQSMLFQPCQSVCCQSVNDVNCKLHFLDCGNFCGKFLLWSRHAMYEWYVNIRSTNQEKKDVFDFSWF